MNRLIEKAMAVNSDSRMTPDELEWLYGRFKDVYKGGNSLEIGAYKGMLSYLCAGIIDEYKGDEVGMHFILDAFDIPIDIDELNTHRYEPHTVEMLMNNLGEYSKYVKPLRSKSLDWDGAHQVIETPFDYVFIDGDHRDPIVYLELCLVEGKVKHIFGHDYGWPGVTMSVDRFLARTGYKIIQPLPGRGVFEIIKE